MSYQLTRPDADQLKFTSSKTGDWSLEDYLQNAEYGNRTLATLLLDLFQTDGTLRTFATPAEVAATLTAAANALTSEASAEASATASQNALTAMNQVFDTFDDRFLGVKAADPTVDNDGDPLLMGAMYYNSGSAQVRFYSGSAWESPSASATNSAASALASATTATTKAGEAAASAASSSTSASTAAVEAAKTTTIPQIIQSDNYTLSLSDNGKQIFHPSTDTTARTWTIPANAAAAFVIGSVITLVNNNAAGAITVVITSDTLRHAGTGLTGSRTLAANGVAVLMKITATEWMISGSGVA